MTMRESAHALIDALPEAELPAVIATLDRLVSGEYPIDHEPLTAAEEESLVRSRRDFAEGRWHTDAEVDRVLDQVTRR